jgi:hypothetical protein
VTSVRSENLDLDFELWVLISNLVCLIKLQEKWVAFNVFFLGGGGWGWRVEKIYCRGG